MRYVAVGICEDESCVQWIRDHGEELSVETQASYLVASGFEKFTLLMIDDRGVWEWDQMGFEISNWMLVGNRVYYDLEFAGRRLRELEWSERLRNVWDWMPGRPRFPGNAIRTLFAILIFGVVAATPLAAHWFYFTGPDWLRIGEGNSAPVVFSFSVFLSMVFLFGVGIWMLPVPESHKIPVGLPCR